MILFYLLPIWSVLGGWFFLNERIDLRRIIAVIICIGGAALTLHLSPSALFSAFDWIDALAILSGLAFVGNNLLFRQSAALSLDKTVEDIPLGSKVAAMYCGCAIQIAVSLLLFPTHATLPSNAAIPLAILYGAVWITLLTFCTQWAVTQMEVARSAIIIVMELVSAVISTALLTAHTLTLHEYIGGLLVLAAALLESVRTDQKIVVRAVST
jgi:drug/metabolite transporter (DMT)-like permease